MEETKETYTIDKQNFVITKLIGMTLFVLFFLMAIGFDKFGSFIDIPSLQLVIVGTIALLFASNDFEYVKCIPFLVSGSLVPKNEMELKPLLRMCDLASRYSIALGAAGSIIGSVLLLGNLRNVDSIGPNMAVALITALYGIIFSELVWVPIKANLLGNYYNQFSNKEELHKQILICQTSEVDTKKKHIALALGVGVPMIVFFLLFFSVSEFLNPRTAGEEKWKNLNIELVTLHNFNVEYSSKEKFFSLDNEFTSLAGISDEIFFPTSSRRKENKWIKPKLTIEPLSKLNHNQSRLLFTLEFEDRKKDSTDYWNRFSYHVTLDTVNHILVEDGDYRIEFDIIPKSIEKATTTPSVSSTLSPIDGE